MKKIDLLGSLLWMLLAGLFAGGGIELGLGSYDEPGPGFFPFLMSIILFGLSMMLFFSSVNRNKKSLIQAPNTFFPESGGIKRILLVIIFLVIYAFVLEYIGFILSTFLFIFFTMKYIEPQKWKTAFLGAVLTATIAYAIFELWLKAHLPSGYL